MRGILRNINNQWVISYFDDRVNNHRIPVHPDDVEEFERNGEITEPWSGQEVEFEIVTPNLRYAKLIPPKAPEGEFRMQIGLPEGQEWSAEDFAMVKAYADGIVEERKKKALESSWDDIRMEFVKTYPIIPIGDVSQLVWLFLKNNYHPPLKR